LIAVRNGITTLANGSGFQAEQRISQRAGRNRKETGGGSQGAADLLDEPLAKLAFLVMVAGAAVIPTNAAVAANHE